VIAVLGRVWKVEAARVTGIEKRKKA